MTLFLVYRWKYQKSIIRSVIKQGMTLFFENMIYLCDIFEKIPNVS